MTSRRSCTATRATDTKWTPGTRREVHRDLEVTLTVDTKWTSYSAALSTWDDDSSHLKHLVNIHNMHMRIKMNTLFCSVALRSTAPKARTHKGAGSFSCLSKLITLLTVSKRQST